MTKEDTKTDGKEVVNKNSIENETRVDEFAVTMFASMGHKGKLSDATVKIYKEFKRRKDKLVPSRLTPEGFAFVSILADMSDGKFDLGEPQKIIGETDGKPKE